MIPAPSRTQRDSNLRLYTLCLSFTGYQRLQALAYDSGVGGGGSKMMKMEAVSTFVLGLFSLLEDVTNCALRQVGSPCHQSLLSLV
jgi:hypothetical protein